MLAAAVYPLLALCAWGVLAFGAVYPWGYEPLASGAAVMGAALLAHGRIRSSILRQPLVLPLAGVLAAIAVQLVPLPVAVLRAVSEARVALLAQYSLSFSAGVPTHPLSIAPAAPKLALVLGMTWAFLLVILASWLSVVGARRFVIGLVVLGVAVAIVGLAQQRPCHACKIYGFWEPQGRGISFAPIVNRNHCAGWMVMVLPLALGLLAASLAASGPRRARTWRDCLASASGPHGSRVVLLTIAAVLMMLSVILSRSRSGALCLVFAVMATVHVLFRTEGGARRRLAATYLLAIVVTAIAWIGPTAVAQGYERVSEKLSDLGGRRGAWSDALSVARDFPLAGTGINTYGAAMLFYQRYDLGFHYTAAHNDYLHLAAEGGLLVAVPAACALVVLIRTVRRRFQEERHRAGGETYWIRVGAATGLMTIAIQEMVDFSLQIPGNAVLFTCLCAIAVHRAPTGSRSY